MTDVTRLFSQFGPFSGKTPYQEVLHDEAAYRAACRWPLLAELQGIDPAPSPQSA